MVDGLPLEEAYQSARRIWIGRALTDCRFDDNRHLQLGNDRAQVFELLVGNDFAQRIDVDFIFPGRERHLSSDRTGIVNFVSDVERGEDFLYRLQCRAAWSVPD